MIQRCQLLDPLIVFRLSSVLHFLKHRKKEEGVLYIEASRVTVDWLLENNVGIFPEALKRSACDQNGTSGKRTSADSFNLKNC